MNRVNFRSLLQRSTAIRTVVRGMALALLAGTLVAIVRYVEAYMTTDSPAAATGVITALLILEAALFVLVERIFRHLA